MATTPEGTAKREQTFRRQSRKARADAAGTYPDSWNELPLTRTHAKELGSGKYFTGKPCRSKGHISPNYTGTGECIQCRAELNQRLTGEGVFRDRYAHRMATDPDFAETKRRDSKAYYERNRGDEEFMEKTRVKNRAYQATPEGKQKSKEAMTRFVESGKKAESDKQYSATPAGKATRVKARKTYIKKIEEETGKAYCHHLYATNPNAKLHARLNSRLREALKRDGGSKSSKTTELIGCTIAELKAHLEAQFTEGMTWENWTIDGWHIDHIRPCASFDLTDSEQQKQAFHYSNLQPLWAEENLRKSDTWEE